MKKTSIKLSKKERQVLRSAARSMACGHTFCCSLLRFTFGKQDLAKKFYSMYKDKANETAVKFWLTPTTYSHYFDGEDYAIEAAVFAAEREMQREAQGARVIALLLMAEIGETYV